jgi:glycosyltransferase involved in cell wall biosynthesis
MFNTMSLNAVWLAKNPNTYSRVLVESEVSATYLRSNEWDQQRVVKVNHSAHRIGVDFSKVQISDLGKNALRVLWFGRMASEKQPWLFLELAQRMQNLTTVEFIMHGSGPLRNKIESETHSHKNLTIPTLHVSALEAMSNVDVYVSTSSNIEGRPLAILEALEMGLRVFTPNSGSVAEFISDGYQGITIYEDQESLCRQIEEYSSKFHDTDKSKISEFNRRISDQRITPLN